MTTDPFAQFTDTDAFRRFVARQTTPVEDAALRRLAAEAGVSDAELERFRDVVIEGARWRQFAEENGLNPELVDASSGRQTPHLTLVPSASKRRRLGWPMGLAAAALLAVGVSLAASGLLRRDAAPTGAADHSGRTIATSRGQRMSLRLSDGTAVVLAPASTIRISAAYGSGERTVQLQGAAVFTVVHDERRPFVVHAGGLVAKDLGTEFVVRAYPDDSAAEIAVAEGEVAVAPISSPADTVVLAPGDHVRQTRADARLTVRRRAPVADYFGWTRGQLMFRGSALGDVAAELGRWYDVDVRLASDTLRSLVVTATFDQQSASEAVGNIALSLGLKMTEVGRTFILSR